MTRIALTINGQPVEADVEPRLHLADFLREHLNLTGTHLGCEHGVCGACTVVIDGEIARSCITYAVACDGAEVCSIEAFDDDEVMRQLRDAFTEEHALQCGFCTPGMLIAARDLVLRRRRLSEREIRMELSGNLCRCTGYVGIIRAVERVMEARKGLPLEARPVRRGPVASSTPSRLREREVVQPLGDGAFSVHHRELKSPSPHPSPPKGERVLGSRVEVATSDFRERNGFTELTQSFTVAFPREEVWRLLGDIRKMAAAMPGVTLDEPVNDEKVTGQITVKLGPVSPAFTGEASITRFAEEYRGVIEGTGRDRKSASGARGRIGYRLSKADGGVATHVEVTMAYALTGMMAQFGRSALVKDLIQRLATAFVQNLEAQLSGRKAGQTAAAPQINLFAIFFSIIRERLVRLLARLAGRHGA